SATASSRNSSSSAASPCAWTHASKCWRVVVIPASIGSTRCTSAGPAPFFACVRCPLAVLFIIGGSLAPALGTVCLGRRDSHADQGAVATQFSSSTGGPDIPAYLARVVSVPLRSLPCGPSRQRRSKGA